jgi:hypothetical protein
MQSFFNLPFKCLALSRCRFKHNVSAGNERGYLGKTKRLEDLAQGLHFDGSAAANIYRSKEGDKSKHSEALIFSTAV